MLNPPIKPALTKRRLRLRGGLAAATLDDFGAALSAEGYAPSVRRAYVSAAAHLGEWASPRKVAIADRLIAALRPSPLCGAPTGPSPEDHAKTTTPVRITPRSA